MRTHGSGDSCRLRPDGLRQACFDDAAVSCGGHSRLRRGKGHSTKLVQVSALECRRSLYFDPVKMSVGLFVAEFVGRLVRDSGADARLWDYVADSLRLLDCMPSGRAVANFPIVFLSTLTAFVGITPDVGGFSEGKAFDTCVQGIFRSGARPWRRAPWPRKPYGLSAEPNVVCKFRPCAVQPGGAQGCSGRDTALLFHSSSGNRGYAFAGGAEGGFGIKPAD